MAGGEVNFLFIFLFVEMPQLLFDLPFPFLQLSVLKLQLDSLLLDFFHQFKLLNRLPQTSDGCYCLFRIYQSRVIQMKNQAFINRNIMDLEALTSEQLELALKLSDILSMEDLTVAAAVLCSFDWNLERALQELQLGPIQQNYTVPPAAIRPSKSSESEQYKYDEIQQEYYDQGQEDGLNQQAEYEYLINQKKQMFQQQYVSLLPLQKSLSEPNKELAILQNHKRLAKDHREHQKEYMSALLSNSEILCKKILDSKKEGMNKYYENKRKIDNNRNFITFLHQTYKPRVNFTFGTFFLNLTRSYLEDKYLLVYIHSVAPQVENKFQKIVELILRQSEIAKFINENCITYGMFDNSDDYQLIQKYVPLKDLPAFALFKLNKTQRKEQFVSSYKISSQGEIFLQWAAKSMGIGLKKKQGSHFEEEKAIKEEIKKKQIETKRKEQQAQANIKRQVQTIAHRDIRKEQDELYAELEKTYHQKKQISLDRKEGIKNNEEQLLKRRQEADNEKEPEPGPNVIEVRFRMPVSGQSKFRRFSLDSKVQKMFAYIDCYCRDEFQEKFNDFDLRQSYPQLSLADKRDQTIGQVFDGSTRENIIVREL